MWQFWTKLFNTLGYTHSSKLADYIQFNLKLIPSKYATLFSIFGFYKKFTALFTFKPKPKNENFKKSYDRKR